MLRRLRNLVPAAAEMLDTDADAVLAEVNELLEPQHRMSA